MMTGQVQAEVGATAASEERIKARQPQLCMDLRGPQHRCCENLAARVKVRQFFIASMGPQHRCCGNSAGMDELNVRGFGFNGAAASLLRKLRLARPLRRAP